MLRLNNISKYFSGVKALSDVSFQLNKGEVHAVCGENGAGKSTLMNIVSGNLSPDSGSMEWNGKPYQPSSVADAQKNGVSIVYQERSLVDSLSIAENIFTVNQPETKAGLINFKKLYQQTEDFLQELGMRTLRLQTLVGRLTPAQKGMVEIAKALSLQPQLLILDEPTASLTHEETTILFSIIRRLREEGKTVVYISHRMNEIHEIADVVTVLKDGKYQGTVPATTPAATIVNMMVGRDLSNVKYTDRSDDAFQIQLVNISGKGFQNVSFEIKQGEIFGLAGLEGAGRTALAKTIFGDMPLSSGKIIFNGANYIPKHPSIAIQKGIGYLPDDRKAEGVFLEISVAENIASTALQGNYKEQSVLKKAELLTDQLGIKTPSVKQKLKKLSGGNQQKVVLAKWLARDPSLLIVNEPTHGVDVGAKSDIYSILNELTKFGKSILLISSELPELLLLADRIGVMYKGYLKQILQKQDATEEKIATIASGIE